MLIELRFHGKLCNVETQDHTSMTKDHIKILKRDKQIHSASATRKIMSF